MKRIVIFCLVFFLTETLLLSCVMSLFILSSEFGRSFSLNEFFEILANMFLIRALFILPFYLAGFLFEYKDDSHLLVRSLITVICTNLVITIFIPQVWEKGALAIFLAILLSCGLLCCAVKLYQKRFA
jgi:hypothetical protein